MGSVAFGSLRGDSSNLRTYALVVCSSDSAATEAETVALASAMAEMDGV